jgi:hypothetical protein
LPADRALLAAVAASAFLLGALCGIGARSIASRIVLLALAVIVLLVAVGGVQLWHALVEGRA